MVAIKTPEPRCSNCVFSAQDGKTLRLICTLNDDRRIDHGTPACNMHMREVGAEGDWE